MSQSLEKRDRELRQMNFVVHFSLWVNIVFAAISMGIVLYARQFGDPSSSDVAFGTFLFLNGLALIGSLAATHSLKRNRPRVHVLAWGLFAYAAFFAGRLIHSRDPFDGLLLSPLFYAACLLYWYRLGKAANP